MKHLMLMRHAQADEKGPDQHDADRRLTRKGMQDARHLHARLLAEGLVPPFVLASNAIRTHTTAQEVTGSDYEGQLSLMPELYNAGLDVLINAAQSLSDQYDAALIVAHNPGVYEAILYWLDHKSLKKLTKETKGAYQPGTLTMLAYPAEKWSSLKPRSATISQIFIPRT